MFYIPVVTYIYHCNLWFIIDHTNFTWILLVKWQYLSCNWNLFYQDEGLELWCLAPLSTIFQIYPYLLTLPLFCGNLPCKSLISRMDWVSCAGDINLPHTLFLPHDIPPTKKSSTIKSWPTFCDQYFWKFPIWNSRADEKRREIRM